MKQMQQRNWRTTREKKITPNTDKKKLLFPKVNSKAILIIIISLVLICFGYINIYTDYFNIKAINYDTLKYGQNAKFQDYINKYLETNIFLFLPSVQTTEIKDSFTILDSIIITKNLPNTIDIKYTYKKLVANINSNKYVAQLDENLNMVNKTDSTTNQDIFTLEELEYISGDLDFDYFTSQRIVEKPSLVESTDTTSTEKPSPKTEIIKEIDIQMLANFRKELVSKAIEAYSSNPYGLKNIIYLSRNNDTDTYFETFLGNLNELEYLKVGDIGGNIIFLENKEIFLKYGTSLIIFKLDNFATQYSNFKRYTQEQDIQTQGKIYDFTLNDKVLVY